MPAKLDRVVGNIISTKNQKVHPRIENAKTVSSVVDGTPICSEWKRVENLHADSLTGGRVYWLTGLSGSGKSTLASRLVERLRTNGRNALLLDGDELRATLDAVTLHARHDRLALAFCYARLCRLLALQGVDVVIATISLFHQVHAWNRENMPNYTEILLDVSLAELRRRDPKNIYADACLGNVSDVAGVDQKVEMPGTPDVVIVFRPGQTPETATAELFEKLRQIRAPV